MRKQIADLSDKVDEIDTLPGEEESRYTEIMQQLKSLDISIFRRQISQLDSTNAEVVVVIPGDDSVDITDARNLIKGGVYQLTDGETSEEVQIKENLGTIENGYRILFTNAVEKSYKNGRARLYRSSAEIADNRAYGGGILREKTWNAGIDFIGSNSAATLSAGIDFSNGLGFDLTGAVVDANNQIVLGEDATGIAITPQGWIRVDAEGDDINV